VVLVAGVEVEAVEDEVEERPSETMPELNDEGEKMEG